VIENNRQSEQLVGHSPHHSSIVANHQNDEIALRQLFFTLWQGKWVVLTLTFLVALVVTIYAIKQPNIYKSQATAVMNYGLYSMDESYPLSLSPSLFNGSELIRTIQGNSEDLQNLISGVSILYDKREQVFTISKTSTSPEEAFAGVELVLTRLNPILKQLELSKVATAVDSVSSLSELNSAEQVKSSLSEIYAQQLYKKAVLENPKSQIVQVVSPPVKPTSHVKPKRPLIIVLGVLLGGMLGVAIVLIRFAFRKED
jgi:uncharacterized protein involved in exopolysaccharide biosynthesis